MSTLTLRVEAQLDETSRRKVLRTFIDIDGAIIGGTHVIDWRELFRTMRGPGEFFIWTAPSGEPLDANIQDCCMVERSGEQLTWQWGEPISLTDLGPKDDRTWRSASFDAAAYEAALWRGWWQACKLLRSDRTLRLQPMGFGESDLLGMDRWIKTDDAKPYEPSYVSYVPPGSTSGPSM